MSIVGVSTSAQTITPGSEILEARDIVVRFGGVLALDHVNISLRRKEIFGLIGPNGAGKSTMINVLSGFQQPTSGEVLIDGRSIQGWSAYHVARSGVARTFQAARLFSALSALENVAVASVNAGGSLATAHKRAGELLAWIGCAERADVPCVALNYSDQRRVGIARALALLPNFVLLDEPAAGMNERECDRLVELIASIPVRWGCGVLLIEHNMAVVMGTARRILVLDGGKPIAEGEPGAIKANAEVRRAYLGDKVDAIVAAS